VIACSDSIKISFEGSEKRIILETESDCCSSTWFEPLIRPKETTSFDGEGESSSADEPSIDLDAKLNDDLDALVGEKILGLEPLDEEITHKPVGDCDEFTGYRFRTDSDKVIEFLMCHTSNGYYSGWMTCRWE